MRHSCEKALESTVENGQQTKRSRIKLLIQENSKPQDLIAVYTYGSDLIAVYTYGSDLIAVYTYGSDLIAVYTYGSDLIAVYTYGSVTKDQSGWGFTVKQGATTFTIHEDSAAYTVSTSILTMEVEVVTHALRWVASRGDTSRTTCHHPHRFSELATKSEKWNGKPSALA